jgi:hypothetical protein
VNLGQIRQEVSDSGLDHLSDTRLNRLVNLAYKKTYNRELWPWRSATTSGTTPLAVTGTIKQVLTSEGAPLSPAEQETLENNSYILTETGTPECWYLDADRSVDVFPATSAAVTVRYYAKAATLTSDSETPDIPEDYHYLIVLDAVRRGKLENGEVEAAAAYKLDYDELLADLKRDAFNEHVAGPYLLTDLSEGV